MNCISCVSVTSTALLIPNNVYDEKKSSSPWGNHAPMQYATNDQRIILQECGFKQVAAWRQFSEEIISFRDNAS